MENSEKVKTLLHRANTRGHANHGWLDTSHTFSFAGYYEEERVHFGLLRVLNDDVVAPGMGFGKHPHDNMEIVSIPLQGALEHSDSEGNKQVIRTGDVQIMSAGSGLRHAEYNHSKEEPVNFLQIWVFPKVRDIEPRYEQKTFAETERKNKLQTIVSPEDSNVLWINQDAYFSRLDLDKGKELDYTVKRKENGVYIFVLEGSVSVEGEVLNKRDGMGITFKEHITLKAEEATQLLLIDVPMED